MPATTVFQAETMDSLRQQLGDRGGELVGELIGLYLVQGRDLVSQIEAAGAASDATRLVAAAHKLKGSTATLGGDRLAAVCQRIEGASAELDVDSATSEVRREFEQLAAELVSYRSSLQPTPGHTEDD
ncbi:MAG TPA: Hpt domain-containing protein [Microlunatus sp.]|jgi:HPt (histidine-containing phosphotransfer) domain-containing protein|nr:Hpt domain-containing protein [Microlunatus sp.]